MGGLKEGYFRVGGGKHLGIKGVGPVDFFFFSWVWKEPWTKIIELKVEIIKGSL